ncbi:hypothetical protein FQN52_007833 [Onygenales sp. PD_12]|nr:hypothetical protein FQN52_007833 [Onygenales sp. PD_12]KAK2798661.1 hypothetical protein FQN51_007522 [Onygenales sp. PD_10]
MLGYIDGYQPRNHHFAEESKTPTTFAVDDETSSASGSASDRRHAMAQFAHNHPLDPVDVIIADYMSEYNMALAAAKRVDSVPAYELSFLESLEPALDDLARYGIKVAVNAGVADTKALYDVVTDMVAGRGLDLKVAWISGDEVLPTMQTAQAAGTSTFKSIHTGETLAEWPFEPIYAQAYLGGLGIAAALDAGADIVLCGRVSDASPVIGAAYWWHGWARGDLEKLANAFVAGHLIECSNYVCGGNFSGFKSLEADGRWVDIAYPIAEISSGGNVVITKQSYVPGGAVTVDTCTAQLLYEIQGPHYFNSDVTAILTDISFTQLATNRVALHGVRAGPPPPTTKVGLTAPGGYQAEISYYLVGLDIPAKARMLESQIRHLLSAQIPHLSLLSFQLLGRSPDNPQSQTSATATLRIVAQARSTTPLSAPLFLKKCLDNIMQAYPGATPHLDVRLGAPKPIYAYHVTLLPQSSIDHRAHLPWLGRSVPIPPPPTTHTYPPRQTMQPATAEPVDLEAFGPTTPAPLGAIVHARSGDKGPDVNVGFWVRREEEYGWLRTVLSVEKVRELLGEDGRGVEIERCEMVGLRGVHFVLRGWFSGATATGGVDFLGKNVAEFLRARWVEVPRGFLGRGRI